MSRLLASLPLLLACLAAACAPAATAGRPVRVSGLTPTSAVVSWRGPAQTRVEYGRPHLFGLWSAPARGGHRVRLRGLLPRTAYEVRLRGGAHVRFRTPAASATTSSVGPRAAILLDGSPFIPVMQWLQCPYYFPREVSLGVNVFLGRGCGNDTDAEEVAALRRLGAYSVLPFDRRVASSPALFGWRFADEPDLDSNTERPAAIRAQYRANRDADRRHINFLSLTSGFYSRSFAPLWTHGNRSVYRAYARATDAIGFDLYPVTGQCRPDRLPEIYAAQRELLRYAGGRPTFQWIEATATPLPGCDGRGVEPAEVRSEAWQALIGGAKAIGYFTHSWQPTYSQFRVARNVRRAMRRTNREVEALAPALLAAPLRVRVSPTGRAVALGRRWHGARYLVVANLERRQLRVTLRLDRGGVFRGFDRSARRLRARAGRAVLTLMPLAVEILVAPPQKG